MRPHLPTARRVAASLAVSAALVAAPVAQRSTPGGSATMSPSVVGTYWITRNASGSGTLDLLVLWRGSPGWFMRRTGFGGGMGSAAGVEYVRQGGVNLTVAFNSATRVARVLDEDVTLLNGANVILVDDVDDPSGPRVVKTLKVNGALGAARVLNYLVLETPELLDYMRCLSQVGRQNRGPGMDYACSTALATGKISGTPTVTPIPEGPVHNRAADLTPPASERPHAGDGSGDRVLSPSVVGAWFAHQDNTGAGLLDLLVLWRGTPGWHLRGVERGSSGGGSATGPESRTVKYGTLALFALFDRVTRRCEIEGKVVALNDHNVVLVDDVDAASGPKVIKTLRVDPVLPDTRRVELAIRKSSELVSFLQCDVKLPDARQQTMMDLICAQVVGR